MRSSVNAVLSFGLVNVPVGVASAVSEKEAITFRQLHDKCGTPIGMKKVCVTCDAALEAEEIVRGYEYAKGQFVTLTDDQYDSLTPERSKVIVITKFVPEGSVEVDRFAKSYHLIPNKVLGNSYAVLHGGLIGTVTWGMGSCTLWGKEHPCLVRGAQTGLLLTLLHPSNVMAVPDFEVSEPSVEELRMAGQLISMMTSEPSPEDFVSGDAERMAAALSSLVMGAEVMAEAAEPIPEASPDVMDALHASIAASGKREKVKVK